MAEWWRDFFDADYLKVYKAHDARAAKEALAVRRILKLRRGQRLLDVCCGYGRHAIPLAQAGLKVTGFDYSRFLLSRGRRECKLQRVAVEWVQGDVRQMDFPPVFDAAINMFTAIGFFKTDAENEQLVVRAAAALKSGGRFLLDTINRDAIVRDFRPRYWMPVGRGFALDNNTMDWETGYMNNHRVLIRPNGSRREQHFTVRLYTLNEMVAIFRRAGLVVTKVLGNFAGSPYKIDSPRIIVIGEKPRR